MRQRLLFLLLCCALATLARSQSDEVLERTISLDTKGLSLEESLYQLQLADVPLLFRNDQLPAKVIDTDFQRAKVRDILDRLFFGTNLRYEASDGAIYVLVDPRIEVRHTISGYVEDVRSGERLIGANVYDRRTGQGVAANEYGFFSLSLRPDSVDLQFSYTGYTTQYRRIALDRSTRYRIRLEPQLTLATVEVRPDPDDVPLGEEYARPPRGLLLDPQLMEVLPSLGGEPDPVRTLQLLPGITSGADGLEGMHLRGGDSGTHLVLLDGVPVYNLGHAAGLFSIFKSQVIRSVELHKQNIPSRYGNRLAGVLDVRTREGNLYEHRAQIEAGLLSVRTSIEGPIVPGKTAFLLSGRFSLIQHLLRPLSRDNKADRGLDGVTEYGFNDLNVKLHHTFGPADRLYFSLYHGEDDFNDSSLRSDTLQYQAENGVRYRWANEQSFEERLNWNNTVAALRWNHLFSERLFSNFTLTLSELDVDGGYLRRDSLRELSSRQVIGGYKLARYQSGIADLGVSWDAQLSPRPGLSWNFGINYTRHAFRPGVLAEEASSSLFPDPALSNDSITTRELGLYVDFNRTFKQWWLRLGVHYNQWLVKQTNYRIPQPRIGVGGRIGGRVGWQLAYDHTAQPIHLLSNTTIGLPTDLWVPATRTVRPAENQQLSLTLDWAPAPDWHVETSWFRKRMRYLYRFSEGARIISNWESNVTVGTGTAEGLEILLRYRNTAVQGWVAYTLSSSDRRFERVNQGRLFPFRYDRRDDLKFVLDWRIKPGLHLSGNWVYSSGSALSLSLESFRLVVPGQPLVPAVDVFVFENKNDFRLPGYHRLDLNLTYEVPARPGRARHRFQLGLYNAYNRRNPIFYDLRTNYVDLNGQLSANRQFVQVYIAPLMPSFSYKVAW
jgi:hypothetical protein